MNPNIPYGQPMPMHPPNRRHDGSYVSMPPQMRPHPGYPAYYPPQMGPMMAPYPPYPAQHWYPYQPHHLPQPHPAHPNRNPQYYPPALPLPQHPHMYSPQPRSAHLPVQGMPRPPHGRMPSLPAASASATPGGVVPPPAASPSPQSSVQSSAQMQHDGSSRAASPATTASQTPHTDAVASVKPFHPPVPWLSVGDQSFPERAPRRKRKIARSALGTEPIEFPIEIPSPAIPSRAPSELSVAPQPDDADAHAVPRADGGEEPTPRRTPTPLTSDAASEGASTQPSTPSSAVPVPVAKPQLTPTQPRAVRPVLPVIPAIPVLPQSPSGAKKAHRDSSVSTPAKASDLEPVADDGRRGSTSTSRGEDVPAAAAGDGPETASPPAPKSWAELVRTSTTSAKAPASASVAPLPNGLTVPKTESLAEVLNEMSSVAPDAVAKVTFLQPRGLVNTGNMCYMNSVLQMLVFCAPFYDFLDRVARRAAHKIKSDTPLIDAMIVLMREYAVIDSAASIDQLRLRLKPEDFEKYGDPFTPEFVYEVIRHLPRFRHMQRGHQQDAQEFLGFLLEELHEECATAMRSGTSASSGVSTPIGSTSNTSEPNEVDGPWLEVGHKQKPAVTRSSGTILTESPVTNIFGGKLRSELKIQGNKLSVTLEPYQPLQLDIGSPQVNNIVDALRGLTRPESMQGDFQSSRGQKANATKQVFIETLPPVLILHLKRFHYDSTTKRAEKIWKKVGYPLELEIPKEVFPTQTRNKLAVHGGLPHYRLIGVIYHHGKNANGGHYTVDIRRQDGREWVRLDDTVIRRIRREDVAEGGSEEDPKVLAAALERHKQQKVAGNRFEQFDHDDDREPEQTDQLWNQVNGHTRTKSSMNTALNGSPTPAKDSSGHQTPSQKSTIKDNKVAYLLFYQRILA